MRDPEPSHIPFVDLSRQHQHLRRDIDDAIASVITANEFILGPDVEAFEHEWADYCEAEFAVGVGSGTAALHLTLDALDIGPGDDVIVPGNTFVGTVLPVIHVGARPVIVDCDQATATIDVDAVAAAVTKHTRAVIPVHLYGQPADMDPLLELAVDVGFDVVEDACQAHGARYRGRRVGALGRAGCFSFYPSKNLGALGDAGAIVTNDPVLAQRLRRLRDFGQQRKHEHLLAGYNERLDTLQAAVLRAKLPHLDRWNDARRAVAETYDNSLGGLDLTLPCALPDRDHVWHLYVIRSRHRDAIRRTLARAGVATGLHYPVPLHLQSVFRFLGYREGTLPVAEDWARQLMSLPIFPDLAHTEATTVAERIADFLRSTPASPDP